MAWFFAKPETDTKARVNLIYNVEPPQELKDRTDLVMVEGERIEKENRKGKKALPYVNPQTGEFWYEYVDRPLTQDEILAEQDERIDLLLRIELESLEGTPIKESHIDGYVGLIERERITVDDIEDEERKAEVEKRLEDSETRE